MNGIKFPATFNIPIRSPKIIKENDFTFGMVARGIKEKGWKECILAFLKLVEKKNNLETNLILVGGGNYLEELKTKLFKI